MGWFILFLVIIIFGCYFAYKEGEIHELHKVRAGFEKFEEAHRESKNLKEFESTLNELEEEAKDFDIF